MNYKETSDKIFNRVTRTLSTVKRVLTHTVNMAELGLKDNDPGSDILLDMVVRKIQRCISNNTLPSKLLPTAECIMDSLYSSDESNIPTDSWSFVYFHGKLHDYYDSLNIRLGDLVRCSIDQYQFPLGMTLVNVSGMPSIVYLWEEKGARKLQDMHNNVYWRKQRHGLVVARDDSDDSHSYALKCMHEQRGYL